MLCFFEALFDFGKSNPDRNQRLEELLATYLTVNTARNILKPHGT